MRKIQTIKVHKNQKSSQQEGKKSKKNTKKLLTVLYSTTSLNAKIDINIAEQLVARLKDYKTMKNRQTEQGMLVNRQDDSLDHIEIMMARNEPIEEVLRLLCLKSLISEGFREKILGFFKREILQCYGFWHLLSLVNLEKSGLLKYKSTKGSDWQYLKDKLKLINTDDDEEASFAYSGYCPLSIRLIENVFKQKHWNGISDILKRIPAPMTYNPKFNWNFKPGSGRKNQAVLIYFIGGVTFAEVSVCRYLALKYNKEIYIATTNMTNGKKLINSLLEIP